MRVLIIGFLHTVEPTTLPHMQFTQNYNFSCPDSSHSCQDVLCSDYKVALLNQKSESDGGQNFDNRQAVSLWEGHIYIASGERDSWSCHWARPSCSRWQNSGLRRGIHFQAQANYWACMLSSDCEWHWCRRHLVLFQLNVLLVSLNTLEMGKIVYFNFIVYNIVKSKFHRQSCS